MPAKKAAKKTSKVRAAAKPKKGAPKRAAAHPVLTPTTVTVVDIIPKSLSGESNQDSEPHVTVNPANPLQIVATAFSPNPGGGSNGPIYFSTDGGNSWDVNPIVPSGAGSQTGTHDITTSFDGSGNELYASILRDPTGNLEFLRTSTFSAPAPMAVLASRPSADQPFVHATTVTRGPDAGKDRVYIGNNDFAGDPTSATVDESLDGASAAPVFTSVRVEKRTTAGQDGPQSRPASHRDGTVYAAFYRWRSTSGNFRLNTLVITSADVIVVRDDNWGQGATPFTDLKDPGDGVAGIRVAQGVSFPFNLFGLPANGQQRIGGSISIAVDPNNSSNVWIAWGDAQPSSFLTLHVRRSADRGKTWSKKDLLTVSDATNAALAITSNGVIGLLCQELVSGARWATRLKFTKDGSLWSDIVLADTPAGAPAKTFDPYLGDYDHLVAVGKDFYGIFSANNTPDSGNFPQGVRYLRNADFSARRLLNVDNTTPVNVSIDPFLFKIMPDPCQPLSETVDNLAQEISDLIDALNSGEIPPPPRTPAKIAQVRALIRKKQQQLIALRKSLQKCQQQNP